MLEEERSGTGQGLNRQDIIDVVLRRNESQ